MMQRLFRSARFRIRRRLEASRSRRTVATLGGAGTLVRFNGTSVITGSDRMVVGNNVIIGDNAFIRAEGGLRIGDNTHISRNLVLYTQNHDFKGENLPYDHRNIHRAVDIGRNVWIGMNVCIVPGSTIGDGAIVGMGTVVSGEVPPMAIIGSQPWRIIGQRDEDHYRDLDARGRFGGHDGRLVTPTRAEE